MTQGRIIPAYDAASGNVNEKALLDNIFITEESAIMSMEVLKNIPTYSHTTPTGAYEGRIWKRHIIIGNDINVTLLGDGAPPEPPSLSRGYVFCFMQISKEYPNSFDIIGKPVQIMDWKALWNIP